MNGTFCCGQQINAKVWVQKNGGVLFQKAHEECGSSWKGELSKETIGHIQSAGCLGQRAVVIAAHNACIRELLQQEINMRTTDSACRRDVRIHSC